MLIGLGNGVEDGHGGQNVGCNCLSCVYLLLGAIGSLLLLLGFVFVVAGRDSQRTNQHDHKRRQPELFHQRQNGFGGHCGLL
ncbi:hypothetical protein DP157_00020 [Klebsiella michiganensis]|nr:hypothetical protein [Klebsiella michiganensis]